MTRFVAVASIALPLFAAPALAGEAPAYRGDYRPPVARDDNAGTSTFGGTHPIAPAAPRTTVAVNPDPTLRNYSANITRSDLHSGR
ncbi:hypothetical protein MesoLjLc_18580 [Mesorhizobium sp. L-8-10]|uniref:hypothetical protein n=1 Tax=unclassified Mesorhizobium TaxID=325217 RepID=UPI0019270E23|nr:MULTISPECIES: hypothetical protein [unclassified Mesorhizobium]BCH22115.1 hypothetical protein MesoLjLb_19000 [Mesorhizobium sp. L-8-3]BCH29928.1 hypothetical protein MesoLjLc_18580 [Mesorhizobium sp. L-8-10]